MLSHPCREEENSHIALHFVLSIPCSFSSRLVAPKSRTTSRPTGSRPSWCHRAYKTTPIFPRLKTAVANWKGNQGALPPSATVTPSAFHLLHPRSLLASTWTAQTRIFRSVMFSHFIHLIFRLELFSYFINLVSFWRFYTFLIREPVARHCDRL